MSIACGIGIGTCPPDWQLLQRVWEGEYLGRPTVVKQRFSKKYRHAVLDSKLTLTRLKQARPLARPTTLHACAGRRVHTIP